MRVETRSYVVIVASIVAVCLAVPDLVSARSVHWLPPDTLAVSVGSDTLVSHSTGTDYYDKRPVGTPVNQKAAFGTQLATTSQGIALTWIRTKVVDEEVVEKTIMYQERNASRSWSPEQEVAQVSTEIVDEGFRDPAIAINGSTVHVVYQDFNDTTQKNEILHRSKTLAGSWTSDVDTLSTPSDTLNARNPTIAVDTDGNTIVTYGEGGARCRVLPDGESTWKAPQLAGGSVYDQFRFADVGCDTTDAECLYVNASSANEAIPFYDSTEGAHKVLFLGNADYLLQEVYRELTCSTWVAIDSTVIDDPLADHCIMDRDLPVVLSGTWNDSTDRFDWWGNANLQQGNVVRNGPRKFEYVGIGDSICAEPCFSSVPASVMEFEQNHVFGYRWNWPAGAAVTEGSEVTFYTLWSEVGGTSYMYDSTGTNPDGRGGDIWCRKWTLDSSGWTKESDIEVVSRTAWYEHPLERAVPYEDLNHWPEATADDEGWIHLLYTRDDASNDTLELAGIPAEQLWPDSTCQVYYATHDHDAADDDWGWEIPVSVRDGELAAAAFPSVAVGSSALHALWTQYNKDNEALDIVYREGIFLASSTAGGDVNEQWNGLVLLDADFTVLAGDTLTITAGTVVYAQTPHTVSQDVQPSGDLPEIIVQGTLLVNGDATDGVLFAPTRRSTTGEWDGIRFENPGQPTSHVSHAIFKNATVALTLNGSTVVVDSCSFDSSSVADISLERDTVIPEGSSWDLAGPLNIRVSDFDAGNGGVDQNHVELIADGELRLDGSAAAVTIECETDSAGAWYGIRSKVNDYTTGSPPAITGTTIRHARNAITLEGFNDFPNLAQIGTHLTFDSYKFKVVLGRDYTVASESTLTIPKNWTLAMTAGRDSSAGGVDGDRVELLVNGTLNIQGDVQEPSALRSDRLPTGQVADWYGIRTPNLAKITTANEGTEIYDARSPLAIVASTPLDLTTLSTKFVLQNNFVDLTLGADYTVAAADSFVVPADFRLGFAANHDAQPATGNMDSSRVELILESGTPGGKLKLNGTSGNEVELLSDDPNPLAGQWYGIRTTNIDEVIGSYAVLSHARGALALESDPAEMPDLDDLASRFTFADNVSQISFDRDLVVGEPDTLALDGNWRFGFTAGNDKADPSGVSPLAELRVEGLLFVDPDSSITFGSDAPNDTLTSWYGLVFETDAYATASPGYGFTCDSYLRDTHIQDAEYGISLRGNCAPSLSGMTFSNIEGGDIFVDSTDVYLPYFWGTGTARGGWTLEAPTTVTVAGSTIDSIIPGPPADTTWNDIVASSGEPMEHGKVDMIVHGQLNTGSTGSDLVVFEADVINQLGMNGDHWSGIYVDWPSQGSVIQDADFGYAMTPLFCFWQDSLAVSDSRFHHFRDQGLWARECYGEISGNYAYRDTTGEPPLGKTHGKIGIVVEDCADLLVQNNTVRMEGMEDNDVGGAGVQLINGKTYCTITPTSPESLRVVGNALTGPGGSTSTGDAAWSGIQGDWECGAGLREHYIAENTITGWNKAGFEFSQSVDVQVSCNRVEDCARAIEFDRNSQPTGPAVRFKNNVLRMGAFGDAGDQSVARTDNATMLRVGATSTSTKGKNLLEAVGEDFFAFYADESEAAWDGRKNAWRRNRGPVFFDAASVRDWIVWEDSPPDTAPSLTSPLASADSSCVPAGSYRPPRVASSDEVWARDTKNGAGESLLQGDELPREILVTELQDPGPNPSRGSVGIAFSLSGDLARPVTVDVFDVTGRRVSRLAEGLLLPGLYRVFWEGRDERGRSVAAGIYFVRMRTEGYEKVRKIALIR